MRTAVLSLFVALLLSAFASAAPLGARAARSFAQLSISTGTGGNALAEAKAKFPGSAASLLSATVSQFNTDAHCAVLAESGFNDAIAKTKSSAQKDSLQVGKIKNKVLKIYGTLLVVQAEVAKAGGKASASQQSQLDDLNSKLAANVKLDQQAKGKASTNVSFNC